jgi:Contractile injection system tube protein
MTLEKAMLIPKDKGVPKIEFMFNPTELTFNKDVEISQNQGSRTQAKGSPKISFSNIHPYKVTINKIVFDTYETGENVVSKYIEPFRRAVQFPDDNSLGKVAGAIAKFAGDAVGGIANKAIDTASKIAGLEKTERTPLYSFVWGSHIHLRCCLVEKLTYKLTLFLPDGTPVRAVIESLSLKETDEPEPSVLGIPIQPSLLLRQQDSIAVRRKK